MSTEDGLPILPHHAGEFYVWLWWATEERQTTFDLGGEVGRFDLWVDDRLAFRHPSETKVTAVMTGEAPASTMESRAALAGGKMLHELRLHLRRDDRDFTFTLKGPGIDVAQAKLPQVVAGSDEAIYDRLHLYDEIGYIVGALFREYVAQRTGDAWESEVLPAMRSWVIGMD